MRKLTYLITVPVPLNISVLVPNALIFVASRTVIKGRLAAKSITIAPDAFIQTTNDIRFSDTDNDNVPDSIEIELNSNPNNPTEAPSLTMPTQWGVSSDIATKNQLVTYSTPEGDSFDIEYPAGSVTSYYYPFLENLQALPAGVSFSLSSDERTSSIHHMHGQLANGSSFNFKFPFSASGQNIGSTSVNVYAYNGESWHKINTKVTSEVMAVSNVGDMGLYVLTINDNVLLVNASSTSSTPDGKTWETSFPTITQAPAVAETGSEIWAAEGIYNPGSNPNSSFTIHGSTTLLGGFTGKGRYYFDRDSKKNVTVFSGDIGAVGVQSDNTHH